MKDISKHYQVAIDLQPGQLAIRAKVARIRRCLLACEGISDQALDAIIANGGFRDCPDDLVELAMHKRNGVCANGARSLATTPAVGIPGEERTT